MSIRYESVENLLTLIKDKKIKPSDVVKDIYDAIEETDPTIKSFLALDKENAIKKTTVNFIIDNIFLRVEDWSNSNILKKFIYLYIDC